MAKKRVCLACGKTYKYCNNCPEFSSRPTWMTEFDCEECKEIFNAVSAYNMELMSANEVKAIIKKYNVTDFSKFKKSIADKLKEVNGMKIEEPKVEPKAEVKEEKAEEPKTSIANSFIKRDKFKKNDNKEKASTEE